MTPAQMETFRERIERARRATSGTSSKGSRPTPDDELQAFLDKRAVRAGRRRRLDGAADPGAGQTRRRRSSRRCPRRPASAPSSTRSARATTPSRRASSRRRRTSRSRPISAPWVNRRKLFARETMADTFKSERIPSTFNWEFSPDGQHIELGIAESEPVYRARPRSACRIRSTASGCCRSAPCTTRSSRAASISSITPATRTPAS